NEPDHHQKGAPMLYSRNSEAAPAGTRDGLTPQPDETRKGVAPMIEHPSPPVPADDEIDSSLRWDGFNPREPYPEYSWRDLRAAYRAGWEDCANSSPE